MYRLLPGYDEPILTFEVIEEELAEARSKLEGEHAKLADLLARRDVLTPEEELDLEYIKETIDILKNREIFWDGILQMVLKTGMRPFVDRD